MKFLILSSLLASSLTAQFSAPSLGLVYDAQAQALRRISGMPGAATLTDPVLSGIASAAIAPDGSFAIVNDGSFKLYTAGALRLLPAGLPNSAQIALSPAGETAAFYADGLFTLLTGLPDQPALQTVAAPGLVRKFAVNARSLLLVSTAQENGEGLFEISPESQPVHLLDITQTSAILFSKDGTKAWLADAADNRVWSLTSFDTSPTTRQIAAAVDGLDAPSALALSPDSQRLYIANGGTASILTFDLTRNTALSSTSCACKPTALSPLAVSSVFALTDLSSGPMWIFDASQSQMQTMFIPAIPEVLQ